MPFELWAWSWNMCQWDPAGVRRCDAGRQWGPVQGCVPRFEKGTGL